MLGLNMEKIQVRNDNNSQGHVISASIAVALSQRYEWAISLSFRFSLQSVLLPDHVGIKIMFLASWVFPVKVVMDVNELDH